MAIKATFYKLSTPNETDKCFTRSTMTTIEDAMEQMRQSCGANSNLKGVVYEFMRYPSCHAVKVLDGVFTDAEDLRRYLLHTIDITEGDYQNTRDWVVSVLTNPRNYRNDYVAKVKTTWRDIASGPETVPTLYTDEQA